MITGRDCREEFAYAKKVVKTEEGKALLKTSEINNKVLLNIRLMLSKVMEALKIDKIKPRILKKGELLESGNDKTLNLIAGEKGKIDIVVK